VLFFLTFKIAMICLPLCFYFFRIYESWFISLVIEFIGKFYIQSFFCVYVLMAMALFYCVFIQNIIDAFYCFWDSLCLR